MSAGVLALSIFHQEHSANGRLCHYPGRADSARVMEKSIAPTVRALEQTENH